MNDKIMNLKEISRNTFGLKMITEKIFSQGFPMVPFPDVERCLGLKPKDSTMRIQDGYAILPFDYKVKPSNVNCIFNMKSNLADKELRMASKNKGLGGFNMEQTTKKL